MLHVAKRGVVDEGGAEAEASAMMLCTASVQQQTSLSLLAAVQRPGDLQSSSTTDGACPSCASAAGQQKPRLSASCLLLQDNACKLAMQYFKHYPPKCRILGTDSGKPHGDMCMQGAQQEARQVIARVAAHNEHLQEIMQQSYSLVEDLHNAGAGADLIFSSVTLPP